MPASDPRVGIHTTAAAKSSAIPSLEELVSHPQDSGGSDELQRIGNMLLQPSPACSPYLHAAPTPLRLPSVDSLPSSTLLAPAAIGGQQHLLPAFELPAAVDDAPAPFFATAGAPPPAAARGPLGTSDGHWIPAVAHGAAGQVSRLLDADHDVREHVEEVLAPPVPLAPAPAPALPPAPPPAPAPAPPPPPMPPPQPQPPLARGNSSRTPQGRSLADLVSGVKKRGRGFL